MTDGSDRNEGPMQHAMSRRIAAYTQERTVEGMTRDEVCKRYAKKVLLVSRRVWERLYADGSVGLEDLASLGAMGLLEAFDRFDPGRGIKFSTFAEYRIRGAIYDGLRENDVLSRRRRRLSNEIEEAEARLERSLGRRPTVEETASHLGIGVEEVWAAKDAPFRVDGKGEEGRSPLDLLVSPDAETPGDRIVAHELRAALKKAILELPERQRMVVVMYYAKEMQLTEIAAVLEVTASRVSQILSESRASLRKKLAARSFEPRDAELRSEP